MRGGLASESLGRNESCIVIVDHRMDVTTFHAIRRPIAIPIRWQQDRAHYNIYIYSIMTSMWVARLVKVVPRKDDGSIDLADQAFGGYTMGN